MGYAVGPLLTRLPPARGACREGAASNALRSPPVSRGERVATERVSPPEPEAQDKLKDAEFRSPQQQQRSS